MEEGVGGAALVETEAADGGIFDRRSGRAHRSGDRSEWGRR